MPNSVKSLGRNDFNLFSNFGESLIKFGKKFSTPSLARGRHRPLTSLSITWPRFDLDVNINRTMKNRSSQLTKRDEADPMMPRPRPDDYKSVPQLFLFQPMNLKRSDDRKLSVNTKVPRPLAATYQSADYGRKRNCRGEALSIDSTRHLLNCCRCPLTLVDYRVVV